MLIGKQDPAGGGGTGPPRSSTCETPVIDQTYKIGTWNVTSMYEAGKTHNIIQEMTRMNIDILGISETRWSGNGQTQIKGHSFYYSGNNDSQHRHGVGIMINKNLSRCVLGFFPLSERVMMLQLKMSTGRMNIIQVYAPTSDKENHEIEAFYKQIKEVFKQVKSRDVTIVMGDLNAKIGKGKTNNLIGEFGLGERNKRGDRLVQFCQENEMVITNTLFQLPNRRLYTWASPKDSKEHRVRNQIDYLMINERYRNSVLSVKTYPGADVSSNHNPLIAKVKVKLKKINQKTLRYAIDTNKLRNPEITERIQNEINEALETLESKEDYNEANINNNWRTLKTKLIKPCNEQLRRDGEVKKDWMTAEILNLMDERRGYKNIDKQKYSALQKKIRLKIREAKEKWYKDKCDEIEKLQNKHDNFNVHRKIKELTKRHGNSHNVLMDEEGKIIIDVEEKLKVWKRYIEKLFDDQREEMDNVNDETGPNITKDEVEYTIKEMKTGKATGPDEVPTEVFKLINDKNIHIIVDLFNSVYKTGIIPKEWLLSTFITIPKKTNAKNCSDHRTISLMCHISKILLKIIHRRIYTKLEADIGQTQFGFRNGLGTREALFAFNILVQRCLDVNQSVYICFLDYNKAFDTVQHKPLIQLLKNKNIDSRDIRIINNLYYHQEAIVRINNKETEAIKIKKGVRQGCVLSPSLFNAYSEEIFNRALQDETAGIKINGLPICNIRYADDTAIITENISDLQRIVNKVAETSEEYGLTLNTKKTKFMLITKTPVDNINLYIKDEQIERVENYNYLGTNINETNDYTKEIRIRIEKARGAFNNMKHILCSRDLRLRLRVRMLKCYIFSILMYGVETWTLNKQSMNKLEAFEMWAYRRILKISWCEKVTNEQVLERMGKEREIIYTVKTRKLQYLGHVARGEKYQLLQLIMQGKIQGKRSIGRRRMSWLRNLREWFGCSSNGLFRAAVSKVRIAMMIANLRSGDGT